MEDQPIVYGYGLAQAIDDGVLVECFPQRWAQLSGGKSIVVTARVAAELSQAALMEIWNGYVTWCQNDKSTLPEEEQLYATTINGHKVWVIEDGQALTILYPEDY